MHLWGKREKTVENCFFEMPDENKEYRKWLQPRERRLYFRAVGEPFINLFSLSVFLLASQGFESGFHTTRKRVDYMPILRIE